MRKQSNPVALARRLHRIERAERAFPAYPAPDDWDNRKWRCLDRLGRSHDRAVAELAMAPVSNRRDLKAKAKLLIYLDSDYDPAAVAAIAKTLAADMLRFV
jgi:hypothetical protein